MASASNVALTTIFTPPDSCFDDSFTPAETGTSSFVKDLNLESTECYPSSFHPLFTVAQPYSPGVCPSGYAVSRIDGTSDHVTTALCCPKYDKSIASRAPLTVPLRYFSPMEGLGCSYKPGSTTIPGLYGVPGQTLAMHGVPIAWASSDLNAFTPASAPLLSAQAKSTSSVPGSTTSGTHTSILHFSGLATRSAGVVSTSTSSSNVPLTETAPASSSSLSTGAKAGIGVGVVIAALLVSAVVIAFVLWRKKRKQYAREQAFIDPYPVGEKNKRSVLTSSHVSYMSMLPEIPSWGRPGPPVQPAGTHNSRPSLGSLSPPGIGEPVLLS